MTTILTYDKKKRQNDKKRLIKAKKTLSALEVTILKTSFAAPEFPRLIEELHNTETLINQLTATLK